MNSDPLANGRNGDGRDAKTGRFAPGWKGGPGNRNARKIAELRQTLLKAVAPERFALAIGHMSK